MCKQGRVWQGCWSWRNCNCRISQSRETVTGGVSQKALRVACLLNEVVLASAHLSHPPGLTMRSASSETDSAKSSGEKGHSRAEQVSGRLLQVMKCDHGRVWAFLLLPFLLTYMGRCGLELGRFIQLLLFCAASFFRLPAPGIYQASTAL